MMLHNRTAGEKIAPLLFTLEVELSQYDGDVLDKGAQILTLKNGVAMSGKEAAGRIAPGVWDYLTRFCTPDVMSRTGYNTFEVSARGETDRSLIVEPANKRPYQFDCGRSKVFPYMLPHEEYLCNLVDCQDHFNVFVGHDKVAEYYDRKNRGKLDVIRKYLSYGWRTTAQLEPYLSECTVIVNICKA